MSTPYRFPDHHLTAEEYEALGEDQPGTRTELQEGVLLVSPGPDRPHMRVLRELVFGMKPQIPAGLELLPDIDVILDPGPRYPTYRRPDIVVAREGDGKPRAADTLLVVEIVSPGSRTEDYKVKPVVYAEAGIPNYWVIDIEPPRVSATVHHLVNGGYEESRREVTGVLSVEEPCPPRIDLDGLAPR